MVKKEHVLKAPEKPRFSVITVSTSRYKTFREGREYVDVSGDRAIERLEGSGLEFNSRYIVPDMPREIREAVLRTIYKDESDLVVLIGGTGISRRDITVEVLSPLFEKTLTNFPALFTLLSYTKVGSDIVTSRAAAGIIRGSLVFCLPGSTDAVQLAIEKIIVPQAKHALHHLRET